ncbi:MAG: spermidine synthase [bacterium]|jgi:spermidine synthase
MDQDFKTLDEKKKAAKVLVLSMLFIGICGISYEYTLSKLASDLLGNSARQWAIVIGLMMFCMGIGADLQKHFPDISIVDQFIFLELLLGIIGGIAPAVILYSFGTFNDHFIIIHYFFICSIGFLIGLEIPILTRINQVKVSSLKHNLGVMLKMDYIGSFIGALIWIFILPKFFNLVEMSLFLGFINTLVAIATWFWFRKAIRWKALLFGGMIGALVLLSTGLFYGKEITSYSEQKLYSDPIRLTKTTPFQHIVLTQRHNKDFYLYINGHLQFASVDEHIYHEFLVHPVLSALKRKKKILVLGGGDGLAVREILKYTSVEEITLVDIDPAMTKLAQTNPLLVKQNQGSLNHQKTKVIPALGVSKGEKITLSMNGRGFFNRHKSVKNVKVNVLNLDAFQFIDSVSDIYDAIIIDFPDPNNLALSKLYSFEFYNHLKKKLAYDGLIIQQSTSPSQAKEAFLLIARTMKAAEFTPVPIHQYIPTFGEWGWWIAGHQKRFPTQKSLKSFIQKKAKLPTKLKYITNDLLNASFVFGKGALETKQNDINKILDDRIFQYYLKAWELHQ